MRAAIAREPGRDRWIGRLEDGVIVAALPGLDGTEAHAAAERLRATAGAGRGRASAGICDVTRAGTAERMLTLALSALAWATAHGRDRTVISSPETVQGAVAGGAPRPSLSTRPSRAAG